MSDLPRVAVAASQNRRTPSDVLDLIHRSHGHDPYVSRVLAGHPNASPELIGHLLKHSDRHTQLKAAVHRNSTVHYHAMDPVQQKHNRGTRWAPPEVHAENRARAKELFGSVLAKHGYVEVPPQPRDHPGRARFVHHEDDRVVSIGVMRMGYPRYVQSPSVFSGGKVRYHKDFVDTDVVMGWKRHQRTDMAAPRGRTPASLDAHLTRVKKMPSFGSSTKAVQDRTPAHRLARWPGDAAWVQRYRNVAGVKPPKTAWDHYKDISRTEALLQAANDLLEDE